MKPKLFNVIHLACGSELLLTDDMDFWCPSCDAYYSEDELIYDIFGLVKTEDDDP